MEALPLTTWRNPRRAPRAAGPRTRIWSGPRIDVEAFALDEAPQVHERPCRDELRDRPFAVPDR